MTRMAALLAALLWFAAFASAAVPQTSGWRLPEKAADEKNPLTITADTLEQGRRLFRQNCSRCHGPQGKGDGSDATPAHRHHMDLTRPEGAKENPDGVVFHKIANGRQRPRMPAFKDRLTRDQLWTLVAYVQSLRAKP
jgi:mono/diheme cytochrome c family protein